MLQVLINGLLIVAVGVLFLILVKMKKQARILRLQGRTIRKHVLELEAQNLQLDKLNHEKLQLIGLVSHDLKGPFNRIFALVQLIHLSKTNFTEEQKEYLGKIHQISVDGLGMVRNLLDSRKIGEKGIELDEAELNVSALVSALVKQYQPIASEKKIEITIETPGALLIRADKNHLSRIIENLISNSVKFSAENKTVNIRVLCHEKTIEVAVQDQGPGISAADRQKLFQRFQTLTAKPTGGETSSGHGLFIAKTIAEKMGADLLCESIEGAGSTFKLILPFRFFIGKNNPPSPR
ncbi:MAG: HAMP domain-containing histidine kinase [Bacteroidetes bacterium]|nr:HAMP domain-containing histidine kinase [Bacteroidota bacterium]